MTNDRLTNLDRQDPERMAKLDQALQELQEQLKKERAQSNNSLDKIARIFNENGDPIAEPLV